jgi:hypothetical protein
LRDEFVRLHGRHEDHLALAEACHRVLALPLSLLGRGVAVDLVCEGDSLLAVSDIF